jgi:hypothetical protein
LSDTAGRLHKPAHIETPRQRSPSRMLNIYSCKQYDNVPKKWILALRLSASTRLTQADKPPHHRD